MNEPKHDMPPVLGRLRRSPWRALQLTLHPQTVVLWLTGSVLAAFTGPFGTYKTTTLWELTGAWLVLLGCAIYLSYLLNEICMAFLRGSSEEVKISVFLVIGSVVVGTAIELLLTHWIAEPGAVRPGHLELIVYTFGVMSVIVIARKIRPTAETALDETGSLHAPAVPATPIPRNCRLAQRLDLPEGARINLISADGHFVEVHTCSSVARIRMRFSDAVAELDGSVGLNVHRSHWVHRDAIRGWVRDTRKPYIVLHNEMQVPVSKTYFDSVSAADLPEMAPPEAE